MWPFDKKYIVPEIKEEKREDNSSIFIPQEKAFDWAHYQAIAHGGIHTAYQDEYDFIPTIRVLKSLYAREPWINFCINAISRQFMNSKHILTFDANGDGKDTQSVTRHPLIYFLSKVGRENPAFFTSNNIIDLALTGNAYVWLAPDLSDKKRIPSERVDLKFQGGRLDSYVITNPDTDVGLQGYNMTLSPEEILHFRMPNPYTPYVGMSLLMAINLPVLIDKYGREFIIGFFLRGGHTSGIIQTDATNADQLTRFVKSIMQAIGGRRNAHGDKVLPKGAVWAGAGAKFSEIQLNDILKDNQTLFRAATGTTNTILGIAENVNRATAVAEMEHFWRMTILPMQYIYCAAIKHSSLWTRFGLDDRWDLKFDNSNVEYIDDFTRRLEEDAKLKPVATVNERRKRLGLEPIERIGDKFEVEVTPAPVTSPFGFSVPVEAIAAKEIEPIVDSDPIEPISEISVIKAEMPKLQEPTSRADSYFQREFARWEDITLANIKNLKKARDIIKKRSTKFAEGYSNIIVNEMVKVYDFHINRLSNTKSFKAKDVTSEADRQAKIDALKERGKRVLQGEAFKMAENSFAGYSETNMERIHSDIAQKIEEGMNLDDVAVYVRQTFGEFYEGQAKTIVRTEFSSAMAQASYQFGNDLATISKEVKKTWLAMGDAHTRADHLALDGVSVQGKAEEVPNMYFKVGGSSYLRYPKDESGNPEDVINCRCDLIWDVVKWE